MAATLVPGGAWNTTVTMEASAAPDLAGKPRSVRAAMVSRHVAALLLRARYLAVGAVCSAVNYGLMLAIDRRDYLVSSVIAFPVVGLLAYILHARFTFRVAPTVPAYLAYLIATASSFLCFVALMAVLHDWLLLDVATAVPIVTLVLVCWNFILARSTIERRPTWIRRATSSASAMLERAGRPAR